MEISRTDLQRLMAHEQIRQVAARYARGVDRLDVVTMRSAYWPDAIDDHGVYVGDAMAFCDRVVSTHRRFDWTMHCILNHWIDVVDDTTAHGEIYNVTYLQRTDRGDGDTVDGDTGDGTDDGTDDAAGAGTDASGTRVLDTWWGRYVDRYECRDGEWRIAHRVCVHEATERRTLDTAIPIAAELFRQGSADRDVAGRS